MSNFAGYFSRSGQGDSSASMWMQWAGQAVGAHEAGDALDAALLVLVQPVHAAVGLGVHAAVGHGEVGAGLLGVLDHPVLVAHDHVDHVPHGGAQALDHLREVKLVAEAEGRLGEGEDVGV